MAERRPIVLVDGDLRELPVGDTLPGGGGDNVDAFYASPLTTDLGATLVTSTSAFASKGNRVIAQIPGRVTQISYDIEAGGIGGAYEAFVAKLSDLTNSATITAIEKIAFVPAAVSGTVTFTTPFNFVSGDILFFGLTKTDIAGAANPLLYFWSVNTDNVRSPYFSFTTNKGVRITSNSLTVGTAITDTNSSWWSTNLTFEPLNALVPQGGTTGQVLSKVDNSDYNLQWVDQTGGGGSSGAATLSGTIDPTTEGADGDFYINTTTWTIFGPKAAGSWPSGTSMIGPAGTNGTNGTDGADGKSTYELAVANGFVGTEQEWLDSLQGQNAPDTFETISKNLAASAATLGYTAGKLTSLTYANGIVKTLNYTGDVLTSIVLSGATPSGIALTKTLQYTGGNLTGVAYS